MKLNRLLAKHDSAGRGRAQRWLAARQVRVNGCVTTDGALEVSRFDRVEVAGALVQAGERALYIMLHKPAGILSATCDPQHATVLDLIDDPGKSELHLAGRLDRASTGLVLLTNDGAWSKLVTEPVFKLEKTYLVQTREPIHPDAVAAFARGFYFHTENLTTRPAGLELLGDKLARVTLREGRYHQIKRMFHRVGNRVAGLHRESIGPLSLPAGLPAGNWRHLGAEEVMRVRLACAAGAA